MSTFLAVDQLRGRKNIVDRSNGHKVGEVGLLLDELSTTGQMVRNNSGMHTKCRIVEMSGVDGDTLAPGTPVQFTADKYGTHVDKDAVAAGGRVDGIVDPDIPKALVPRDTFLLFIEGPSTVVVSAAVTTQQVASSGSGKVAEAAAGDVGVFARTLENGSAMSDGDKLRVYLLCETRQLASIFAGP